MDKGNDKSKTIGKEHSNDSRGTEDSKNSSTSKSDRNEQEIPQGDEGKMKGNNSVEKNSKNTSKK